MMKIKTIKKMIAMFSLVAVSVCTFGMNMAVAGNTVDVPAELTRGTGGGAEAPIIKSKWEMKGHIDFDTDGNVINMGMWDGEGNMDDNPVADYTQLAPSGVFESSVPYTICAVVTDQGIENANISSVAALGILYPQNTAFHPHSTIADQIDGGPNQGDQTPQGETSPGNDPGESGCNADMTGADEVGFTRLTKDDGIELFCDRVQGDNTNLPWFYESPTGTIYDYNEICAADGELRENHAFVYCGTHELYYEDPAGDYTVVVKAQTIDGQTDIETNILQYLELQSFDIDFHNGIDYGTIVSTNQWYGAGDGVTDGGDRDFVNTPMRPTVRNLGNVRLYIGVEQDDMGFGTMSGNSNINYRARIGSEDADWLVYDPNLEDPNDTETVAWMEDILDLSEDEKMDFNVRVVQWPADEDMWNGDMVLSCQRAEFRACVQ